MIPARPLLLLAVTTIGTIGCEKPAAKTLSIANTGLGAIELEADPSSGVRRIQLGPEGTKVFRPAQPVWLGDAKVYLNQAGHLEVANSGSEFVHVVYTNDSGESKNMILGEDAIGFFGRASSIEVGDASFAIAD